MISIIPATQPCWLTDVDTLVKWVPGSHRDPAKILGANRDPAEVARFPGGILPGKNSRCVSRQESRREICTRRDPA